MGRKQNLKKLAKVAHPISKLDYENTILLDLRKGGLQCVPLSDAATSKLILAESTMNLGAAFDFNRSEAKTFNDVLSFENIFNAGGIHKIAEVFNALNMKVVISPHAWFRLKRQMARYDRLMVPYRFDVPDQFVAGQLSDEVKVSGPYVEDVYDHEINAYKKRLDDLGLTDGSKAGGFKLFPYQVQDAARIACKSTAFIGLEQGLGKTAISISATLIHNNKRVLVVCPGPAVGSWKSGWKHEIHRLGVPKENIHVMSSADDLPFDYTAYPDNDYPHYFITNYTALSSEKWEYHPYTCPANNCGHKVDPKDKGKCKNFSHPYSTSRYLLACPHCFAKAKSKDPDLHYSNSYRSKDEWKKLRDMWTGRYCDPDKGGCGWKSATRIPKNKKTTNPNPMWRAMRSGMFQAALFDESQLVKNVKSLRGSAVQHIPGLKRCYIITGTMMKNYIADTFWQLQPLFKGRFPIEGQLVNFMASPNHSSRAEKFSDRFEDQIGRFGVSRIRDPEALWSMMSKVQVRRKSEDEEVESQVKLPEINYHTELIEMDEQHQTLYDMKTGVFQQQMNAALKAEAERRGESIDIKSLSPIEIEKRLDILRTISAVPIVDAGYDKEFTTKELRLHQIVDDEVNQGNKVVIFSAFHALTDKMQDDFKAKKYNPIVLDGRIPMAQRFALIDDWRGLDKNKVCIAGIKSMNYAVNLTAVDPGFECRTVVFMSPEWTPADMAQAWKRVHRIGQRKDVNVYFLYQKDTVEERINEVIYAKGRSIATAIDRQAQQTEEDGPEVTMRSTAQIAEMILSKQKEAVTT